VCGAEGVRVEPQRVERVDAPHGEQAFQRHVRCDREHDQRDHRLDAASACADQQLAAATRGKRHAEAEEKSADKVRRPCDLRRRVNRFARIGEPGRLEPCHTGDRYRDREQPHAHAPPVADGDEIGHRAHGAEVDTVRHRAEYDREPERASCDQRGEMLKILHGSTFRRCEFLVGWGANYRTQA